MLTTSNRKNDFEEKEYLPGNIKVDPSVCLTIPVMHRIFAFILGTGFPVDAK